MIVLTKNINKRVKIFLLIKMSIETVRKTKKNSAQLSTKSFCIAISIAKASESSKTTFYMVIKRYKSSLSIKRGKRSALRIRKQQLVFDDHSRKIPAYRTENEPKGIKFQSISSGKLRNFTI